MGHSTERSMWRVHAWLSIPVCLPACALLCDVMPLQFATRWGVNAKGAAGRVVPCFFHDGPACAPARTSHLLLPHHTHRTHIQFGPSLPLLVHWHPSSPRAQWFAKLDRDAGARVSNSMPLDVPCCVMHLPDLSGQPPPPPPWFQPPAPVMPATLTFKSGGVTCTDHVVQRRWLGEVASGSSLDPSHARMTRASVCHYCVLSDEALDPLMHLLLRRAGSGPGLPVRSLLCRPLSHSCFSLSRLGVKACPLLEPRCPL